MDHPTASNTKSPASKMSPVSVTKLSSDPQKPKKTDSVAVAVEMNDSVAVAVDFQPEKDSSLFSRVFSACYAPMIDEETLAAVKADENNASGEVEGVEKVDGEAVVKNDQEQVQQVVSSQSGQRNVVMADVDFNNPTEVQALIDGIRSKQIEALVTNCNQQNDVPVEVEPSFENKTNLQNNMQNTYSGMNTVSGMQPTMNQMPVMQSMPNVQPNVNNGSFSQPMMNQVPMNYNLPNGQPGSYNGSFGQPMMNQVPADYNFYNGQSDGNNVAFGQPMMNQMPASYNMTNGQSGTNNGCFGQPMMNQMPTSYNMPNGQSGTNNGCFGQPMMNQMQSMPNMQPVKNKGPAMISSTSQQENHDAPDTPSPLASPSAIQDTTLNPQPVPEACSFPQLYNNQSLSSEMESIMLQIDEARMKLASDNLDVKEQLEIVNSLQELTVAAEELNKSK